MPEIPRTKFNSPWTVAVIEAALNDVSSAKGSSESLTAALNAMRAEINSLSGGVHLKGAVDYYNDLPASPTEGDAYTVRYQGASGTDPLGIEYAWATYQGTPQWIPIGVDPSVFAKQTEMNCVANAGAKNLLKYRKDVTSLSAGNVYARTNSDGTLSVGLTSGTTATAQLVFTLGSITKYRDRKLILSGCPAGGNYQSGYALYVSNDGSTAQADMGSGATLPIVTGVTSSVVALIVRNGTTISSELTFRPMVRDASIVDSTFQPYALSNPVITPALIEIVDGGDKNLVNAPSGSNIRFINIPIVLQPGDFYVLFQNISSTDTDAATCQFGAFAEDDSTASNFQQLSRGNNTGRMFTVTKQTAYVRLYAANSFASGDGDTVAFTGCMICTAADWAISQTFQPYRPSWQEMYDMILAIQSGGNRALTMQTEPEEQEER